MRNPNDDYEAGVEMDEVRSFLAYLQANPEAKRKLEAELLEGIRSPKIVADEAFWAERRKKILDKHPE